MADSVERNGNGRPFRAAALDLQRAFVSLGPIIERTRMLSANAEIMAARLGERGYPFSIIARELVYVVGELEKLIAELERVFRQVARLCADSMKAEHRVRALHNTLHRLERSVGRGQALVESGTGADGASLPVVQPGTADDGDAVRAEARALLPALPAMAAPSAVGRWSHANATQLRSTLATNRGQMLDDTEALVQAMRSTVRLVDRMSWVAVRHSHFTAITASVEAAKLDERGVGLEGVAGEIRTLSDAIASAERTARDYVLSVSGRFGRRSRQVEPTGVTP